MEKTIERIIIRKYPELASGWHLPLWARVTDTLSPLAGQTENEDDAVFSVSVQLLKSNGEDDVEVPIIENVLLPVPAGGGLRGFWAKPMPDTIVEIAFAYGLPSHPFIRSILPHGLTLPSMEADAQRWQQDDKSYLQVSAAGEWEQKGKKSTLTIEEDLQEQIGNLREIIAKKHHVGSESINIYKLLFDLMNTVADLANVASGHSHSYSWSDPGGAGTTSPPIQMAGHTQAMLQAKQQAGKLEPLLK